MVRSDEHLLVVSDEASLRDELVAILASEGRQVETTALTPLPDVSGAALVVLVPPEAEIEHDRVCRLVERWVDEGTPVLVVVDPERVRDEARACFGATDLIRLPLSEWEVRVRVRSVLRASGLQRDLARQADDLERLLALSREVGASLDVEGILFQLVEGLATSVHVERCSLVLLEADGRHGLVKATSDDREVRDLEIDLSDYPEFEAVVRSQRALVIDDVAQEPLLERAQGTLSEQRVGALAIFPLVVDEELVGLVALRREQSSGGFSDRELAFAGAGAHAVAIAVRNARLIEHARSAHERESQERRRAERRLENLKRFEDLFEHVGEGLVLVGLDDRILGANAWARKHFAFVDPLLGATFTSVLVREEDRAWWVRMSQGGACRSEIRLPDPETGERILSVLVSPLSGGALVVSLRDVTEERRLADELRKASDFLENLIDSSADAIVAADLRGHILLWNAAAARITGWSREEATTSLHVARLYPDEWAYEVMRQLRSEEGGGKGRLTSVRVDLLSKSGERIPVSLSAAILYEGEREIATMGIFTDLRERLQIERKLSHAQDRLIRSEQQAMIAGLAGAAAHELNQPLTSVMGYAELLRRRLSEDDPNLRAVDIIYRESERMAEIVRKIGRITRFETKSYLGDTRIVDLERATEDES